MPAASHSITVPGKARPIRVVFERDEPLHYNTTLAAEKLGMSRQYLTELAAERIDGKPTVFAPCGKFGNDNIYHVYQIKLISLAMRGRLSLREASQFWRDIEDHETAHAMSAAQGKVTV